MSTCAVMKKRTHARAAVLVAILVAGSRSQHLRGHTTYQIRRLRTATGPTPPCSWMRHRNRICMPRTCSLECSTRTASWTLGTATDRCQRLPLRCSTRSLPATSSAGSLPCRLPGLLGTSSGGEPGASTDGRRSTSSERRRPTPRRCPSSNQRTPVASPPSPLAPGTRAVCAPAARRCAGDSTAGIKLKHPREC